MKDRCDHCHVVLVYPCVGLGCPFVEDSDIKMFCNDACREAWLRTPHYIVTDDHEVVDRRDSVAFAACATREGAEAALRLLSL